MIGTWAWAQSKTQPAKPAPKQSGEPDIKTGVAFTPISITPSPAVVDGTSTAESNITTTVELVQTRFSLRNGRPRLISYTYKPGLTKLTPDTFRVKVFAVQMNGNNIVGVPSQNARDSWKWIDSSGALQDWPMEGAPLTVSGTGARVLKIRYVGGASGRRVNFFFRVHNGTDNTVTDITAVTGIRIK